MDVRELREWAGAHGFEPRGPDGMRCVGEGVMFDLAFDGETVATRVGHATGEPERPWPEYVVWNDVVSLPASDVGPVPAHGVVEGIGLTRTVLGYLMSNGLAPAPWMTPEYLAHKGCAWDDATRRWAGVGRRRADSTSMTGEE